MWSGDERPQTNLHHPNVEAQNSNSHRIAIAQSKASSTLFLIVIIAKLERTLSTILQNKELTQNTLTMGVTTNNESSTKNPT